MIAVCDYGIGNLRSAEKALQHVGARARLVDDPAELVEADGVVLPGVGAFGPCAEALEGAGLMPAVRQVLEDGMPFLGICVGFQLLYEWSEESPGVPGLGYFPGGVRRLPDDVKRPQMQWNQLRRVAATPSGLLEGLASDVWVYFVHSFAPERTDDTVAVCDYGQRLTAAAERGPVWGVQFHPEKSGPAGLQLLAGFVARCQGGSVREAAGGRFTRPVADGRTRAAGGRGA